MTCLAFLTLCALASLVLLSATVEGHTGACPGAYSVDHTHRGNKTRALITQLGLTPANAVECFSLFAQGTQNYVCSSGNGTWTLANPNAVLYTSPPRNCNGRAHPPAVYGLTGSVVSHFFLPSADANGGRASWESDVDGSRVTTRAASSPVAASAPSPDGPGNIAWLSTVKTSGDDGPLFGSVVAVVRANTRGGVAPDAALCDRAGKVTFVPYTANYVYYAAGAPTP